MARVKLTPWQKIVRAYERRTGLYLTLDEIDQLNMDDAITTRAILDAHPDLEEHYVAAEVKRYRERVEKGE